MVRDVASLEALLADIPPEDLARAADLLEKADIVYLMGQLRSAPVVDLLRYVLTMLGKRCVLLDPSGGLATHMARTIRKGDVLVAVSFRFYATEVVNVVEEAAARGVVIIAISDSTLSPLAKGAEILFLRAGARVHLFALAGRADVPRAGTHRRACGATSEQRRGSAHSDGDQSVEQRAGRPRGLWNQSCRYSLIGPSGTGMPATARPRRTGRS